MLLVPSQYVQPCRQRRWGIIRRLNPPPVAKADDYQKVVGYCEEGKRLTMWVPLPSKTNALRCFEPVPRPFADVIEHCGTSLSGDLVVFDWTGANQHVVMSPVEEIRLPAYAVSLVAVGGLVLLGVMALVSIRNRMLQRQYALLAGSVKASGNEIEMQFLNSSELNLIEREDLDRICKRD